MKTLLNILANQQPQVVIDQDPDTIKANFVFMWCEKHYKELNSVSRKINWVFCFIVKREVTKVLSTGALEASVSRFDSDLPDKMVH